MPMLVSAGVYSLLAARGANLTPAKIKKMPLLCQHHGGKFGELKR